MTLGGDQKCRIPVLGLLFIKNERALMGVRLLRSYEAHSKEYVWTSGHQIVSQSQGASLSSSVRKVTTDWHQ